MKKILAILFLSTSILLAKTASSPWGFWAHKRINHMALFTLPQELFAFYKPHVDYISEHAVDPDKRRYAVEGEAPKHYIDLNHYGAYPFHEIPRRWFDAIVKYPEDTLQAYGIVPWHIERMMFWLTDAMKEKDVNKILKTTAELGHYIADAHVPLHCNKNYNGQLTNQHGIHAFWESRIPELLGEKYDYVVGTAEYIPDINKKVWEIVLMSNLMSDSVLNLEAQLNEEFPSDRKYSYETRGQTTVRTYSKEYTLAYNTLIDNMVERRIRETIMNLGSFWLTAWINAGKPNLSGLELKAWTEEELKEIQEIDNASKTMEKMKGRQEE
ncbi:MAG: zinc dependent phospholipase C family protein [Chitinophagales bacterium]